MAKLLQLGETLLHHGKGINNLWTWLANHWSWFKKWYGEGTPDDRRNPFWRLTEALAVKVDWAWTFLDLRFIYRGKDGKWRLFDWRLPYKTEQNFWNGFFTVQLYFVGWMDSLGNRWCWPKLHFVFRPCHRYYLLIATPGLLFDRGEFQAKFALMDWISERDEYGCTEPPDWEEGSV